MSKLSVALLAECVFMATKHGRELVARELKKTSYHSAPNDKPLHPAAQSFMQQAIGRKGQATREALKEEFERYDEWYNKERDKWVDLNLHRLYGLTAEQGEQLRRNVLAQKRILMQRKCDGSTNFSE